MSRYIYFPLFLQFDSNIILKDKIMVLFPNNIPYSTAAMKWPGRRCVLICRRSWNKITCWIIFVGLNVHIYIVLFSNTLGSRVTIKFLFLFLFYSYKNFVIGVSSYTTYIICNFTNSFIYIFFGRNCNLQLTYSK